MSKRRTILLIGSIALSAGAALAAPPASRPTPSRTELGPDRAQVDDHSRRIDINQINMWVTNFGSFAWDIATGNSGLVYPKGSGKRAVFAAGLWLGGTVGGQARVVVAEYSQEFGPGGMAGGSFDDPKRPEYKVFKVVRWVGNAADSAHLDRSPAELAADPDLDPLAHHSWSEYMTGAAPHGAPWRSYRLPATETPDPADSVDVPGPDVLGDQMLWCVYNDADPALHTNAAGGTSPLGVEVQQTAFASATLGGLLGRAVFLKFRIINKGANTLEDCYASVWSDPDLGGFQDDLVGCDSTLGLAFAYNADNDDQVYGSAPPAVGIDLVLGPTTGATLTMSAFSRHIAGSDPASPFETYNYMRGLLADGSPVISPVTGLPTRYSYSGDPVLGSGWLDAGPSDRRMLTSAGPLRLAPGDTVEALASIALSQGSDRLASILDLKLADLVTSVLVSLAHARAEPNWVEVRWHVQGDATWIRIQRFNRAAWADVGTATPDGEGFVTYQDHDLDPGGRYGYRLALNDGAEEVHAGETWIIVPSALRFGLDWLGPSPSQGDPQVSFELPSAAPARLELFDITGRRLVNREVGMLGPGRHVLVLGGERRIPAGVHVLKLTQAGEVAVRKVVVVR